MFAYGPLGFVRVPQVWNLASLVGGLIYTGAALALLTVVPYLILSRQGSRVAAFMFASALVLAAPTLGFLPEILSLGALLLAIGAFQGTLSSPLTPLAGLLGAVAAIQCLVKPPTAAVALLACMLVVLAPRPGMLRRGGVAAATFLVTFFTAWLAVAQSLSDLPTWIASEVDLMRHYSEAMFIAPVGRSYEYIAAALLTAGLIAYAVQFAVRMPRRSSVLMGTVVALALWIMAKQAFVRHDAHSTLFFFAVPAIATALWTTRPTPTRPLAILVASGAVLTTLAIGSTLAAELDAGSPLRSFLSQVTYVARPGRRATASEEAKVRLRGIYALPPLVLASVAGRTVHVDPYETSLVWAYDLHWRPVPVFQRYQAYSARSDAANAHALETDARAPERIVRDESPGIDGRNILWDSPRYMLSLVCRYRQLAAAPPWQILGRATPRCGRVHIDNAMRFRANEMVAVPRATGRKLVVVWLDVDEPMLERLRTVLFRPQSPIIVNADGTDYRIATSQVAGPLLLSVPPAVGWAREFGGGTEYKSFKVNRAGSATFATIQLH